MRTITRRQALIELGAGAAGLLILPPRLIAQTVPAGIPELAARIRETPRDEIFDLAADAIAHGATRSDLLGASFLAGVHDVRPRHVGGKLHCVMMIESVFELATIVDEQSAWLLAIWAMDDFKRSQARDRSGGDWTLPPRVDVAFASEAQARGEFQAAMAEWDEERADRAITGLIPFHGHASIFEILWPYGARSFVNIGHKIIYLAQVERTLRRIGWSHAEPVLRSLVYGLLNTDGTRGTDAFESSVALGPRLPDRWLEGREAPERSLDLMVVLRDLSREDAQATVVDAIGEGLGPNSVWDALRLWGAELCLQRSSSWPPERGAALLSVHAVTVTEAFGHVFATSVDEETRRLSLLQAAGWLAQLRQGLDDRGAVDLHRGGLETLDPASAPASLEDLLADPTPELLLGHLQRRAGDAPETLRRLVRGLALGGREHHQHKYTAALAIESRRLHPRWRPHLISTAVPYLGHPRSVETQAARRGRTALEQANAL